jgi:dsRNA-specific ribonuclease
LHLAGPPETSRCTDVIKKPTIIAILVVAIVAALYYGASPKDRDRWLAHLGLSKSAAARVRHDLKAEQKAAAAQQQQRELRQAYAAASGNSTSDEPTVELSSTVLDPEAACARFRELTRLRKESGAEDDSGTSNLQKELEKRCGAH